MATGEPGEGLRGRLEAVSSFASRGPSTPARNRTPANCAGVHVAAPPTTRGPSITIAGFASEGACGAYCRAAKGDGPVAPVSRNPDALATP